MSDFIKPKIDLSEHHFDQPPIPQAKKLVFDSVEASASPIAKQLQAPEMPTILEQITDPKKQANDLLIAILSDEKLTRTSKMIAVENLLKNGADPNLTFPADHPEYPELTPAQAVMNKDLSLLKLFLDNGASLDSRFPKTHSDYSELTLAQAIKKQFNIYHPDIYWLLKYLVNKQTPLELPTELPRETVKRIVFAEQNVCDPGFMKDFLKPLVNKYIPISDEEALCFVADLSPDTNDPLYQYRNTQQHAYAAWANIMALDAQDMMSQRTFNFTELLKQLGNSRRALALATANDNAQSYGVLRKEGNYSDVIMTLLANTYTPWNQYFNSKHPGEKIVTFNLCGLQGEEIPGTTIANKNWYHLTNINTKLTHAEAITRHILTTDFTGKTDELIDALAQWYHTQCQATLYRRGSSAITQILFVALCRMKGIQPPKALRLIDCWALSMPLEDFRKEIFRPWFTGKEIPLVKTYQGLKNPNLK